MPKHIGTSGPINLKTSAPNRNLNYVPAANPKKVQPGDANRIPGAGSQLPINSAITKPPFIDPAGGTHMGTQMRGGINKPIESKEKFPSTLSKTDKGKY